MNDDKYLAHYGVLGMKWGVRHDRPSSGGAKKFVYSQGKTLKRLGIATRDRVNKVKKAYDDRLRKSVQKKLAKDRYKASKDELKTLKSKDTRKYRQIALSTHDPAQLQKYQHLLTDEELSGRIKRLEMEDKVNNMAIKRKNAGFKAFKDRADWAMNSPVGKSAISIGSAWASKKLGLGEKPAGDESASNNTSSNNSNRASSNNSTRTSRARNAYSQRRRSSYRPTGNAYQSAAKEYVRSRYAQVRGLPSGK